VTSNKSLGLQLENFDRREPQCFRETDPDRAEILDPKISSRAFVGRWPNPLWVGLLEDREEEP
jgi:hypothetical protein